MVLNLVQPYDSEVLWNTGAFSKMGQLRLLKLCDMQLPLGLNCLPSALQVLHWRGCPLKALPLWHGTKVNTIYLELFLNFFVITIVTQKANIVFVSTILILNSFWKS